MNNKIKNKRTLQDLRAEAEAEKVLMFQNSIVENRYLHLNASRVVQLQFAWEAQDNTQPNNISIRNIIRESQNKPN